MGQVTTDFDARVAALSRKNRRTIWFLFGAVFTAAVVFTLFVWVRGNGVLDSAPHDAWFMPLLGDGAGNALWAANNLANLAAGAALRIWMIREDKMTLLLTHAIAISGEKDVALRVLLNSQIRN